jgi:hypothetical protein
MTMPTEIHYLISSDKKGLVDLPTLYTLIFFFIFFVFP